MLQGRAAVLEDADAENAAPHLEEARVQMGQKYGQPDGRHAATAGGRSRRWVVLEPDHVVTWDNFKLGQLQR